MASIKTVSLKAGCVMNSVTIGVRVTGCRRAMLRLRLGMALVRLGFRITGCKADMEVGA